MHPHRFDMWLGRQGRKVLAIIFFIMALPLLVQAHRNGTTSSAWFFAVSSLAFMLLSAVVIAEGVRATAFVATLFCMGGLSFFAVATAAYGEIPLMSGPTYDVLERAAFGICGLTLGALTLFGLFRIGSVFSQPRKYTGTEDGGEPPERIAHLLQGVRSHGKEAA